MVRLRHTVAKAQQELTQFLCGRAHHWHKQGNFAIACDYAVRALNTNMQQHHLQQQKQQEISSVLTLGVELGKRVQQPEFSEKCRAVLDDLAAKDEAAMHSIERELAANIQNVENEKTQQTWEHLSVGERVSLSDVNEHVKRVQQQQQQQHSSDVLLEVRDVEPFGRGLFVKDSALSRKKVAAGAVKPGSVLFTEAPEVFYPLKHSICPACPSSLPKLNTGGTTGADRRGNDGAEEGSAEFGAAPNVCGVCGEKYCSQSCCDAASAKFHAPLCMNFMFKAWEDALVDQLQVATTGEASRAALTCLVVGRICAQATMQQLHPLHLPFIAMLRGGVSYETAPTFANTGAMVVELAESLRQTNLYLEDFLSLYAIVQCNEILEPEYGSLLCPTISLINHSCVPNCAVVKGTQQQGGNHASADGGGGSTRRCVVALEPLHAGQQIFVDYNAQVPASASFSVGERNKLLKQRFFQCNCSKCLRQRLEKSMGSR